MADNKNYANKSLISHMTSKVPVVPHRFTLAQTERYIRKNIHHFDNIDYIYVVDDGYKLIHVISIKDIYRLSTKDKVYMVGKGRKIVKVLNTSHREQAAYLALKNKITAVPIVDSEGKFLGVVNKHNVLSILYNELREDIFHMTGIHKSHVEYDSIHEVSLYKAVKHTILWLIIGLFGGML
ncbi:MAG: CBS domain-containing protein, partial [Nanoarchaeota archaeon]